MEGLSCASGGLPNVVRWRLVFPGVHSGLSLGMHGKFGFHLGTVLRSGGRFSFLPSGRNTSRH